MSSLKANADSKLAAPFPWSNPSTHGANPWGQIIQQAIGRIFYPENKSENQQKWSISNRSSESPKYPKIIIIFQPVDELSVLALRHCEAASHGWEGAKRPSQSGGLRCLDDQGAVLAVPLCELPCLCSALIRLQVGGIALQLGRSGADPWSANKFK